MVATSDVRTGNQNSVKSLKVGFVDFAGSWGVWPSPVDFFTKVLSLEYEVEVVVSDFIGCRFDSGKKPDLIIYAIAGKEHLKYDCPRIFFPMEIKKLHENQSNYDECNGCLVWNFDCGPNEYRLPGSNLYGDYDLLLQPKPSFDDLWNREFCCVMFGRSWPHEQTPREAFFHMLCDYKKVHSVGHYLNNMGVDVPGAFGAVMGAQSGPNKVNFLRKYKFALSFENAEFPGYTTEKLTDAMFANCIPIYWGNPIVGRDFNTKSMVNCHEYSNFDEVIARIIELDTKPDAYRSVIEQPYFTDNVVSDGYKKEKLLQFIQKVLW